jgi:sucrose phosphorylase
VQDLLGLIKFRNTHPAFSGSFQLLDSGDSTLILRWEAGAEFAQLRVELDTAEYELSVSAGPGVVQRHFISAPPQPGLLR